jgi:NNP family nitrate/nitrite transporter-like MFS transporter
VGLLLLAFLFAPLAIIWRGADTLPTLLAAGFMLGTAGASFAVALPLASRWYPPERQGLVMGIAAAGNSGTVLTNLFAPRLAEYIGWHGVFGFAMLPLAIVVVVFAVLAKEPPRRAEAPKQLLPANIRHMDLAWFCIFYSITFGGYVGLSSFLPTFFRDQYTVSKVGAGTLTAICALSGSLSRPVGGYLADKVGGARLLVVVLGGAAVMYALASRLPSLGLCLACMVGAMICLGMGNGAVFQLVPLRFPKEIGSVTGIVGAVGGLGGFFLPNILGTVKQGLGSFGPGLVVLAFMAFAAAITLHLITRAQENWRMSWRSLP